jgi:hypothetical protein
MPSFDHYKIALADFDFGEKTLNGVVKADATRVELR